MPLTEIAIRNAKAIEKPFKLFDEKGLFLLVTPGGGKWWRLKYRFGGKAKTLSLGTYPDVPLAGRKNKQSSEWIDGARDKRDNARRLLANGINPSDVRKSVKAAGADRAANSFEMTAREWFLKYSPTWASNHAGRIIRRFERDIFPWIGARPVAEITPQELLTVLRRIEKRGALETAHRALSNCGQVFRYAISSGRAERDPAGNLRGALPPCKGEHLAAITEPKQVAELLRAIEGYQGTLTVRCAMRLAPLVFVRPGELRKAEWADIDLESAEWRFTVTKTGTSHIVPLSSQAIEILRELQPLTGGGRFVFPGVRTSSRPMSDNAVLAALRRMGIGKDEMSGHGFRAMARTILDEVLGIRPDFIEHQLAHAVRDPNGRAYNRTAHLAERRKMMQGWADYLEKLKCSEVVPPNGNSA